MVARRAAKTCQGARAGGAGQDGWITGRCRYSCTLMYPSYNTVLTPHHPHQSPTHTTRTHHAWTAPRKTPLRVEQVHFTENPMRNLRRTSSVSMSSGLGECPAMWGSCRQTTATGNMCSISLRSAVYTGLPGRWLDRSAGHRQPKCHDAM